MVRLILFFAFLVVGLAGGLAGELVGSAWGDSFSANQDPLNHYQFDGKKQRWFEWWYYKVVLPERDEAFFFVYGVVNPLDQRNKTGAAGAHLGMGDFKSLVQVEKKVPVEKFWASEKKTSVEIGADQAAQGDRIKGSIQKDGKRYRWDIALEKRWAFNSTGWATGRNLTNIEWYPAQADAKCSGVIHREFEKIEFENADCYQDRNWGVSFPEWWTWIVSNDFEGHPETTLAVGGGKPKILGRDTPIEGVAIGFKHLGKEYMFRPNHLDIVRVDINFGRWEIWAESLTHRIEISAYAPPEKFMDLQFVTPSGEVFHDFEALQGDVFVKLYRRRGLGWRLVDTVVSHSAGIEWGSQNAGALEDLFFGFRQLQ